MATNQLTLDELPGSTLTTNTSFLQPTGFKVIIDRRNFPNLQYFAQSIIHPSLSLPPTEQSYRNVSTLAFAGDKLEYTELGCTIVLDEDMKGYQEMIDWMERIVTTPARKPTRFLANDPAQHASDITISVLSSANNQVRQIRYINAIPISVGEIMFEATVGDIQYITYQVTFRFDYFQLV
jgi:hypothetical protein